MKQQHHATLLAALLFCGIFPAAAQSGASMIGAGYAKPAPVLVAPGQIVTLFFRGVGALPSGPARIEEANALPLPSTLAGLSLKITQAGAESALRVPLLAVRQEQECPARDAVCTITSIRAQIPYELRASTTPRLGDKGVKVPDAELVLEEDGKVSRSFAIRPVSENGHVVTSCDISGDLNPDSTCSRVAYHSDGSAVNADSPARRGETILLYAYGLGQPNPAAVSGEAPRAGLSVLDAAEPRFFVTMQDEFLNAAAWLPRAITAEPYNRPWAKVDFGGLAQGQVGLYQINIPIPASFRVSVPCGPDPAVGAIRSNGLLQLTTVQGTENIPICVAP